MKEVDISNVKRWATASNNHLSQPVSIAATCPSCLLHGVFTTKRRHYDPQRDTLACSAECPSCNTQVHFWMTNMVAHSNNDASEHPALYMMPASEERMNLENLPDSLPGNVLQYCHSTQEVYKSGNLTATYVMVQSTLSAIFENFLPTGNSVTQLPKLIQDSLPSMGLDKPIANLAVSLRPEGHLDSLLKSPEPATREIARALMDLIEKLVTYLYVLPSEFDELNRQLKELDRRAHVLQGTPDHSRDRHPARTGRD